MSNNGRASCSVPLQELISDAQPGFASGARDERGTIQVRMNNVSREGALDLTSVCRIPATAAQRARYLLQPGDVLFNQTNSPSLVGKSALFRGFGEPLVFSNHFLRLRVRPEKLDLSYLAHWLTYQWRQGRFEHLCVQWVNQATLRKEELLQLGLPLPPLLEQKRIAAILDKADALRRKRREAIAKLDSLLQSVFLEIFGDPTANPEGWPVVPFGDLIIDGPQNGLYKPESAYGSGTPILRINSFYNGKVTKLEQLRRVRLSESEARGFGLKPHDIVINRVNSLSHLGKSAIVPELHEPTVFESNMMRMSVDHRRLNPHYLIHLLQDGFIKAQILRCAKDAVNQSSINQQDVVGLKIVLPSLHQQEVFTRFASRLEVQTARGLSSLERMDDLFMALQARSFRGELFKCDHRQAPQLCLTLSS